MVECCPKEKKEDWEYKQWDWHEKPFYRGKVFVVMKMPLNYSQEIARMTKEMQKKKLEPADKWIMLQEDKTFGNAEILFALKHWKPDPDIKKVSGSFISKYFKGGYNGLGQPVKELVEHVKNKTGLPPKKLFFMYATCPKCAEKQGGPTTIIFAQI